MYCQLSNMKKFYVIQQLIYRLIHGCVQADVLLYFVNNSTKIEGSCLKFHHV